MGGWAEKFSRTLSTRVVAERAVASLRLSRKTFSFVEFENFSPENKGLYLQHDYLIFQTKMFHMYENIAWLKVRDPSMLCSFIGVPCTAMLFTCTDCNDMHPHANTTEAYALASFPRKGICCVCFHPRSVLCRCVRNESSLSWSGRMQVPSLVMGFQAPCPTSEFTSLAISARSTWSWNLQLCGSPVKSRRDGASATLDLLGTRA